MTCPESDEEPSFLQILYHSITTKDDNMLCINYTIKTGTVREQMRNLLKRLLFSSRQAFLLSKTACKAA